MLKTKTFLIRMAYAIVKLFFLKLSLTISPLWGIYPWAILLITLGIYAYLSMYMLWHPLLEAENLPTAEFSESDVIKYPEQVLALCLGTSFILFKWGFVWFPILDIIVTVASCIVNSFVAKNVKKS